MKRCSVGFGLLALVLEAISWLYSGFLFLFFIDDSSMSKYNFTPGTMFLLTLSWVVVLVLTASLIYQAWGCVRIMNSRLVPSNFDTESMPAIAFVLTNAIPAIFASISGANGLAINVGIGKEALNFFFAVVVFLPAFSYIMYSQLRRNQVRDFLNETTEEQFSDVLQKTNALEGL